MIPRLKRCTRPTFGNLASTAALRSRTVTSFGCLAGKSQVIVGFPLRETVSDTILAIVVR